MERRENRKDSVVASHSFFVISHTQRRPTGQNRWCCIVCPVDLRHSQGAFEEPEQISGRRSLTDRYKEDFSAKVPILSVIIGLSFYF